MKPGIRVALISCAATLMLTLPGEAKTWRHFGLLKRLVERLHSDSRIDCCAPGDGGPSAGAGDKAAAPRMAPVPEMIGLPRPKADSVSNAILATLVVTPIERTNPEIERRLGEWKAVNLSGPV